MIPQPEEKDGLVVTLNKMGYMNTQPEPYNQAFINYAASCSGTCLEIGAAYGLSPLSALKKGAKMIANDLSADHLDILWKNTPESLKTRLTLMPGAFPAAITLPDNSIDAVLSSRMLNFIEPDSLPAAIKTIFNWLKPEGKFFLLLGAPYMGNFYRFIPNYLQNKAQNKKWPGLIEDMRAFIPERAEDLHDFINLLDIETIAPLLTQAGFLIEKIGYSGATNAHPDDMRADGREHVGAIAIKPKQ